MRGKAVRGGERAMSAEFNNSKEEETVVEEIGVETSEEEKVSRAASSW